MTRLTAFSHDIPRYLSDRSETLSQLFDWLARVRKARDGHAVLAHLMTLDSWQLDDMGIDQRDLTEALNCRWNEDPTMRLNEIRRRKQMADRI